MGRTGFAHLYEHLMFMGTKNVPNSQFDQIMESEGGNNNASTGNDRTFYYDFGPTHPVADPPVAGSGGSPTCRRR